MKEFYDWLYQLNAIYFLILTFLGLILAFLGWWIIFIGITKLFDFWGIKVKLGESWKTVEKNAKIGNVTIRSVPVLEDKDIAYRLWIELTTRKIALPLDKENDIILEVYDSWYPFFGLARETLKEIPAHLLSKPDIQKIISIVKDQILNKAMRGHLTLWQGKYRKWYDDLSDSDKKDKTPQEIQNNYPEIRQLLEDMSKTNEFIINEANKLKKLIKV